MKLIPSFTLTRLRIAHGSDVAFDEQFHRGVNIIRGENSSGKSTISDFIFYGLGGEFDRWKAAAAQCSAVRLEIETQNVRFTAHRSVGGKQEPIFIYYGSLEDSLSKGIDHWQRVPIRRPSGGKDLSFTQVMFRAAGIPEAQNVENSNITMHQMLRLLYSDQQTPAGKLFRFESFDTRDTREAVGQLVIGVNGYELYELQLKIRELQSEYADKDRLYKSALLALPQSEGLASMAALNQRIEDTISVRAITLNEIAEVDSLIDGKAVDKFLTDRRLMQDRLRKLASRLQAEERRVSDLKDEQIEIRQFIDYLTKQLEVLDAAQNLSDQIGVIEFQYCPACLMPLAATASDHCIVCHQVVDEDNSKSRYFEIRIDTEHQLRESKQLLDSKEAELLSLSGDLRAIRRDYATAVTEFSGRYDVTNSPRESFLAERNKLIGKLDRELVFLEEIRSIVEKLDKLSQERSDLNDKLSYFQARMKQLEASSFVRVRKAMTSVDVIGRRLLRGDLTREDAFDDPASFTINFGDDAMLVDGKMNFSESSNVVLKNSAILSIFLAACYDEDFWHPKFLLMDNIEDKGMEPERSHNYQRLIVAESEKARFPHQIIFTTSMINPALEGSSYTVGQKYTRANKTLKL